MAVAIDQLGQLCQLMELLHLRSLEGSVSPRLPETWSGFFYPSSASYGIRRQPERFLEHPLLSNIAGMSYRSVGAERDCNC